MVESRIWEFILMLGKVFGWLPLQRPQCVCGLLTMETFQLNYKREVIIGYSKNLYYNFE